MIRASFIVALMVALIAVAVIAVLFGYFSTEYIAQMHMHT